LWFRGRGPPPPEISSDLDRPRNSLQLWSGRPTPPPPPEVTPDLECSSNLQQLWSRCLGHPLGDYAGFRLVVKFCATLVPAYHPPPPPSEITLDLRSSSNFPPPPPLQPIGLLYRSEHVLREYISGSPLSPASSLLCSGGDGITSGCYWQSKLQCFYFRWRRSCIIPEFIFCCG